jgi:large subunit ribosomal protein L21
MTQAVIKVLGKQYHVEQGSKISCHKIQALEGETLEFDTMGSFANFASKGKVKATVLKHYLDEKKIIFYKTQRGHDKHKRGFRAQLTLLRIDAIEEAK